MYRWYQENPEWKKPVVAVRAIDWEIWQGLVRDQAIIDWVDHAICIAPHMERKLRSEARWGDKLHLIPCGVNTTRFSLKKKFGGYNVLIPCNEIDWVLKNVPEGMKIFAMLKKRLPDLPWKLFIRGKWCQGEYFKVYIQDLINKLGIFADTTIIDQGVPDYNEFLEDMDYCLLPSYKEAFSYVTGECAAKGIKPILNWWFGAEEIWPSTWLYRRPDEAVEMFCERVSNKQIDLDSNEYGYSLRKWIIENKNSEEMCKKFDEVLGT
jgi:glycosyltransferase involved in cell wall biosynthesis